MPEEVSILMSRFAELANVEGSVPEDGSGVDGVWTTTVPASARDRDWKVAMNADTETERPVQDFRRGGDEAVIPAGKATVWLGGMPVGVVGPYGGQLVCERTDDGPESIEDELIDDVETRIDVLEEGDNAA